MQPEGCQGKEDSSREPGATSSALHGTGGLTDTLLSRHSSVSLQPSHVVYLEGSKREDHTVSYREQLTPWASSKSRSDLLDTRLVAGQYGAGFLNWGTEMIEMVFHYCDWKANTQGFFTQYIQINKVWCSPAYGRAGKMKEQERVHLKRQNWG